MIRVMLRPKWIAAFGLVLVIITVFILLSQWQFGRADEQANVVEYDYESQVALESIQDVLGPASNESAGHMVKVKGTLVKEAPILISDRTQNGKPGYWLMGRIRTTDSTGEAEIAAALGWAQTVQDSLAAYDKIEYPTASTDYVGRLFPTEPAYTDELIHDNILKAASTATIVNLWRGPLASDRYNQYLVLNESFAGLSVIPTLPPDPEVQPNSLNLFYGAEWIFFALFALYIWYRLVRDEYQAELEENEPELAMRRLE